METTKASLEPAPTTPSLSVVVVAVYNLTHLVLCITALTKQVSAPDMEIIVVCHDSIRYVQTLTETFPTLIILRAPGQQTQGKMLSLGISRARGKIVALTVDHCTPAENWCGRLIAAHATPYAVIGGSLDIGIQPKTAVNWAVHLYDYCSYGYYQNPVKRGAARELSDCNVSYKRDVLDRTTDLWAHEFNVPLMNKAFLDRGETLWFSPDLLVFQHRSIEFYNAARIAYHRGRVFASARVAKFTFIQRISHMLFSPFLPLKLLGKLIANVLPKKLHLEDLARTFPLIALFSTLWSLGEFVGFLLGKRKDAIPVTEE